MHVTLRVNSEALTWHCPSELAGVKWSQSAVGPAPRGESWEADCPDQMLAASVLPLADSWQQITAPPPPLLSPLREQSLNTRLLATPVR